TEVRLGVAAAADRSLPGGLTAALARDHEDEAKGDRSTPEKALATQRANLSLVDVTTRAEPLDEKAARAWIKPPSAPGTKVKGDEAPDAVLWLHGPRPRTDDDVDGNHDGAGPGPLEAEGAELFWDSTSSDSSLAKRRTQK